MTRFSVIIPTSNRCQTLEQTIRSCMAQDDDHLRIVVSDNYSTDGTRELVKQLAEKDGRITYQQPPHRMSLAAHWEYCLTTQPEGQYAMLLGSDDALLPGCMKRARAALHAHPEIEVLHSYPCPAYYYDDSQSPNAGKLFMVLRQESEVRQSHQWLRQVAGAKAEITQLPFPYQQSWVKTEVFQRIISKTGRLIHSPMPDLFLAVAVAAVTESYLSVYPGFGLGGYSASSNGSATTQPRGDRALEDQFYAENEITLHEKVNYSRSLPVLVGEVLLQAKEKGLLPPDTIIAWEKFIARAWVECHTWDWSPEETAENEAALRRLAQTMGCEEVLQQSSSFRSIRDWEASTDWLIDWPRYPIDLVLDTRPLQVRGVDEVAALAEDLLQCASPDNAVPAKAITRVIEHRMKRMAPAADADPHLLLRAVVVKNVELQLELQESASLITRLRAESARRAQERDKAKAKSREYREQIDRLRKEKMK
ncbi:glycosyltransferase [Verrucomicrobium sp. BvORR106]|uniref:glycosyltransferase family 2 protein n=1 Tax=Verrucomicrobium sp. BvORR106 TaxID=1403819 RepID=UPI002240F902|nr:glycosyltransferase [Verrucomicrobium sp. BvORR106]